MVVECDHGASVRVVREHSEAVVVPVRVIHRRRPVLGESLTMTRLQLVVTSGPARNDAERIRVTQRRRAPVGLHSVPADGLPRADGTIQGTAPAWLFPFFAFLVSLLGHRVGLNGTFSPVPGGVMRTEVV